MYSLPHANLLIEIFLHCVNNVNDSKHFENAFFHTEFKLILIFQIKAYNTFSIIHQSRVCGVH